MVIPAAVHPAANLLEVTEAQAAVPVRAEAAEAVPAETPLVSLSTMPT